MTAVEYRRLRRMLQRERQKGLLALDLLTDVAAQNDRVVDEPGVSGVDDRGRSYQRRHADLGEGLARTRVLLTSSRYVVVTSALQA